MKTYLYKEIKRHIRQHYGLNGNQKIKLNNDYTFRMMIGDCAADIPFPIHITRELKLNELLK